MIGTLWRLFFGICCFSKGPQDLPASKEFFVVTLSAYCFASFFQASSMQSVDIAILMGLMDAFILVVLCYFLLYLSRRPERWLQTITALFGAGIVFSIVSIPLSFLIPIIGNNNPVVYWLYLIVIALMVWNVAVMAHIMRHALSSSFALGVLAALLYVWVLYTAVFSFFPPQTVA